MDRLLSQTVAVGRPVLEFRQADFGVPLSAFGRTLDWTIRSGEQWAIHGTTGSGKALIINGILKHTPLVSGRILYYFDPNSGEGRSFFNSGDVARVSTGDWGYRHHGLPGFYQSRWHSMQATDTPTVADYLKYERLYRISPFEVLDTPVPYPEDHSETESIIDLTGIRPLMDRRVHHLSHGELQKTLIAKALIQGPKLLILEEPFAGLDTRSRSRFRDILGALLNAKNMHILMATARPEDIPDGVTHILDMEAGRAAPWRRTNRQAVSAHIRPWEAPDVSEGPGLSPKTLDKPDSPVIIDIKNTTVNYDGIPILDCIYWQVRKGERWAVLGPNGAGKSTLLSLILADNPKVYANDITIFGKKRGTGETIWDIKRPIGWMSPELQIYYQKQMTCLEVVCSGFFDSIGLYRPCSGPQALTAKQWMAVLGLTDLEAKFFPRISEGRQRLTLIARALVKSPTLLVLDEPCQGLDRNTRSNIIGLIDQVCRKTGATLLYVTHDTEELPGVITHVLRLDGGRVTSCGERNTPSK